MKVLFLVALVLALVFCAVYFVFYKEEPFANIADGKTEPGLQRTAGSADKGRLNTLDVGQHTAEKKEKREIEQELLDTYTTKVQPTVEEDKIEELDTSKEAEPAPIFIFLMDKTAKINNTTAFEDTYARGYVGTLRTSAKSFDFDPKVFSNASMCALFGDTDSELLGWNGEHTMLENSQVASDSPFLCDITNDNLLDAVQSILNFYQGKLGRAVAISSIVDYVSLNRGFLQQKKKIF